MCTEFFLALAYLAIISVINYFLFLLVKSYIKTIFSLKKLKNSI